MSTTPRRLARIGIRARPHLGASMVELLIVVVVIVVLVAIVGQMLTGTGGKEGVKDRAERQIQQLNLHYIHQGFAGFATGNDGKYPSTKTVQGMEEDSASAVFAFLIGDGWLAGPQLISENEYLGNEITPGSADRFGPENTSFALNDYDAENWLRYTNWNMNSGSPFALLSDRWIDDPAYPDLHTINETYWHVLMNDGATKMSSDATRPGAAEDDLFEKNSSFRDLDALMVHD